MYDFLMVLFTVSVYCGAMWLKFKVTPEIEQLLRHNKIDLARYSE